MNKPTHFKATGGKLIAENPLKSIGVDYNRHPDEVQEMMCNEEAFNRFEQYRLDPANQPFSNAPDGIYPADAFEDVVWQYDAPNNLIREWKDVHENSEWRMEIAKNNGCYVRQFAALKEKQEVKLEDEPGALTVAYMAGVFDERKRIEQIGNSLLSLSAKPYHLMPAEYFFTDLLDKIKNP